MLLVDALGSPWGEEFNRDLLAAAASYPFAYEANE
jgi:UDP-N-acetylglucosamine 2-epimerase